ncbi:hypothetical protein DFJ73DRAFT_815243 [Zopfochytrium polystomum]|nr:hypothetical protein DFJ73DRAFT_815243 [Zopfochytrium polystomum]
MPSARTLPVALASVTFVVTAAFVSAHGRMTDPPSRYAIGLDNYDHQRSPMQLRGATFPSGWTTPLIPCGGVLKSQSKIAETAVVAGDDLSVSWEMG